MLSLFRGSAAGSLWTLDQRQAPPTLFLWCIISLHLHSGHHTHCRGTLQSTGAPLKRCQLFNHGEALSGREIEAPDVIRGGTWEGKRWKNFQWAADVENASVFKMFIYINTWKLGKHWHFRNDGSLKLCIPFGYWFRLWWIFDNFPSRFNH